MPPTRQSQLLPSPPPFPISRPLFPRLLAVFAQIRTRHSLPPKLPARWLNLCHSSLRRDSPRYIRMYTIRHDSFFFERYRYRKENLPLPLHAITFLLICETVSIKVKDAGRKVSRIHLVQRLNIAECRGKWRNRRLGDQSRRGSWRASRRGCYGTLHPRPLVPFKGTNRLLSSDNTLLMDRTSPYDLQPLPVLLPSRGLTSRIPVTHWYSREVSHPCETLRKVWT